MKKIREMELSLKEANWSRVYFFTEGKLQTMQLGE